MNRHAVLRCALVTLGALGALAAAPFAAAQSFAELATNDRPGRHQRLVEAATCARESTTGRRTGRRARTARMAPGGKGWRRTWA